MVRISWNSSVLEPDWNLPNYDIVTIWLDSLSVDFANVALLYVILVIRTLVLDLWLVRQDSQAPVHTPLLRHMNSPVLLPYLVGIVSVSEITCRRPDPPEPIFWLPHECLKLAPSSV